LLTRILGVASVVEVVTAVALLLCGHIGAAIAQPTSPAGPGAPPPVAAEKSSFDALKGTWLRPDGGYIIAIRSVGANWQIDAMYFNPNQLPFSKAQATLDGAKLRVALELRAGGYDGSTYDLVYDPATNRLTGTYYQAVAKQNFEVFFVRR